MILYGLRRLVYLVPVAFGVSLLVFGLVHLAPGDAISAIVPPDAPQEVVGRLLLEELIQPVYVFLC